MRYLVNWDTDGEVIDLPPMVDVPGDVEPDEAADWITDKFGWCVSNLVEA